MDFSENFLKTPTFFFLFFDNYLRTESSLLFWKLEYKFPSHLKLFDVPTA